MLLKPLNQLDKGKQDPYAQSYTGEVIDNNDPEKLKRIKVNISIWDTLTDDQKQWVVPESSSSASADTANHNIPEVGSIVKVFFNNNDPNDPVYTGAGVTEGTRSSLYDEDYPNTYGEKDSIGNFTMTNKETGVTVYHHNSGTEIQMDPDGSYMISNKTGTYVACDEAGNFRIHGAKVSVIADDELSLSSRKITLSAKNNLNLVSNNIELIGNESLKTNSPNTEVNGNICNFKSGIVTIAHAFSVESCGNWTLYDPLSKKYVEFVNGVLKTAVFI